MTSYSTEPQTISELRALQSGDAADWTVRDMLVHYLREIDAGRLDLTAAVFIYAGKADGERENWNFTAAGTRNVYETLGLLGQCTFSIQHSLEVGDL